MNPRLGSVFRRNGRWYARVTFLDPATGKRRDIRRRARSKAEACRLREELLEEIDARLNPPLTGTLGQRGNVVDLEAARRRRYEEEDQAEDDPA